LIIVERPASIVRSLFGMWLFWFIGGEITVLTYKLILPKRLPFHTPLTVWFWFPLFCGGFAAVGVLLYAIFKTYKRRSDPYRFSSCQYRFAVIPKVQKEKITNNILALGFSETSSESSNDWISSRYTRSFKAIETPKGDQSTEWQVLNFAYSGSSGRMIIEGYLSWRIIKRLFRFAIDNDTYDLLEDIIARSELEGFLTDENWHSKSTRPIKDHA